MYIHSLLSQCIHGPINDALVSIESRALQTSSWASGWAVPPQYLGRMSSGAHLHCMGGGSPIQGLLPDGLCTAQTSSVTTNNHNNKDPWHSPGQGLYNW